MGPLRAEIEPIVAADGWTKAAMGKMWKLDSFLRESQRYNGIGISAPLFPYPAASADRNVASSHQRPSHVSRSRT